MQVLFLMTSLYAFCTGQDYHNKNMIIKMNGHDHQVHDFLSETVNTLYIQQVESIREQIYSAVVNDAVDPI